MVNVLHRVGPDEDNHADDVRVVQRLIQLMAMGSNVAVNGSFDEMTGFWIFYAQVQWKGRGHPGVIVDGVISPARGSAYGAGGAVWTITLFNYTAKLHSPGEFAAFLSQSAP
jgi:hypothetical protein